MILEQLYQRITIIINQYREDIDNVDIMYSKISLDGINIADLIEKTDQDIKSFCEKKEETKFKQELVEKLFQKIKLEKGLDELQDDIKEDNIQEKEKKISDYFSSFLEPDKIELDEHEVKIIYNLSNTEKLMKKLDYINAWNKDNVIETISKKLKIDSESIELIDSVSSYVKFISSFEETNYVSRGQKDCTYKLIPSLFRIYDSSYKNHSSQFETAFRQKVLYYDKSIETKDTEELRAYAQHFGLPTNYLDFTEAHLISLLFAVEEFEYVDNHAIVYFIDAISYNRDVIKEEKLIDFSDKNLKKTTEDCYSDKSYFIRVGNSNERIHFQKGCFLKVEPNDSFSDMLKNYTKIAIVDKDYKESILKELFSLGITFENIYPDKDNMVKTIKFIKNHLN